MGRLNGGFLGLARGDGGFFSFCSVGREGNREFGVWGYGNIVYLVCSRFWRFRKRI